LKEFFTYFSVLLHDKNITSEVEKRKDKKELSEMSCYKFSSLDRDDKTHNNNNIACSQFNK